MVRVLSETHRPCAERDSDGVYSVRYRDHVIQSRKDSPRPDARGVLRGEDYGNRGILCGVDRNLHCPPMSELHVSDGDEQLSGDDKRLAVLLPVMWSFGTVRMDYRRCVTSVELRWD